MNSINFKTMRHLRVSNNSSTCRALFLNQMLYFVMQQLRLLKIIKAVSICNNFLQHFHMTTIESLYKTFSYYSKSKYLSLPSGYSFWKWMNFLVLLSQWRTLHYLILSKFYSWFLQQICNSWNSVLFTVFNNLWSCF